MTPSSSRLQASGFVAGILASLATTSKLSFVLGDRFDLALYAAYLRLRELETKYHVDVRFRAVLGTDGTCTSFAEALSLSLSWGVASIHDSDLVPLLRSPLEHLAGTPALYHDLAAVFLNTYRNYPSESFINSTNHN